MITDRDVAKCMAESGGSFVSKLGAAALVRRCTGTEAAAGAGQADTAFESGKHLIRCHEALVEGLRDAAGQR